MVERCGWATSDPLYIAYHDDEWGVPEHDDRKLFEMLILEGAQAGLSWITILKRREGYRQAFDNFDPATVAAYDDGKVERLLQDTGIIRNRAKIRSAVTNARRYLEIQAEHGSFDRYLWAFVNGQPVVADWATLAGVPAKTELSDRISKDLKKRGFSFVGSTIVYAYLQATGVVNDHSQTCFRAPAPTAAPMSGAQPAPTRSDAGVSSFAPGTAPEVRRVRAPGAPPLTAR
jgi:DNA-3-methyladenine glycosylase I